MFTLAEKLTFINIDQSYLKKLHDACSEVYYKPGGYENKPYTFCLKVINEVIGKANKLYDKQMETGKVVKFCCDFKALEEVADK